MFSSIISAMTAVGATPAQIVAAVSSTAGGLLNSVSSQVKADLNQLASLLNNPAAYAAAAPSIITKIESINGLPATVLPLLESLRSNTNPLGVAQTIAAIESLA